MTHRLGGMINGDWRRCITADATGMDAKRFTTFSAGPGACAFAKQWYYIFNHPWEVKVALANPDWNIIVPVHRLSDTQPDQTVYMTNVQYEMFAGTAIANILSGPNIVAGDESRYKYCLITTMHPTDKMLEYCKADWERYEDLITNHYSENGYGSHAKVPYPYTMKDVDQWFDSYNNDPIWRLNFKIRKEGASEAYKKAVVEDYLILDKYIKTGMIPHLIKEARLCPNATAAEDDPYQDAVLAKTYEMKKGLTASDSESARNFDPDKMEEWADLVSGENEFKSIEVKKQPFPGFFLPISSEELLKDPAGWGGFVPFLLEKLG